MGDTAQQTLLKVAADGSVSYDFEGHISAEGLDLLASDDISTPPQDRKVRWLRQSDGSTVAEVFGFDASGVTAGELRAKDPADAQRYAKLQTVVGSGGPTARVWAIARYGASTGFRMVTDQDGKSDFLQQTPAAKTTVAFGKADNVPTPALGVGGAANLTFAHGLTFTPTYAFVTIRPGGGLYYGFSVIGTFAVSVTQITATVHNHAGAVGASTINLQWLAVKIG